MEIAYIVAECRPSTDEDNYADINIGDDSYIFCSIEPVMDTGNWQKNIQAAILIGIDIERTRPPQGLIEGMIMQESRGDTYRKGKLLTSPVGAQGLAQFMPGTAKQYGVDVTNEESSINGMIKYVSDLLKMFKGDVEKAVMAYNAGPENVRTGKAYGFKETRNYLSNVKSFAAGKNGYSTGDITSKDFNKMLEDSAKMAEEQAKLRLQLENDVANEVTKIRNDLAKKLEDVDKANFTPERKAEIKAELQARADNDVAIAQQALKTKLDDYKQFNMTEEQLLKDSFDRKKFNAAHDIELSKNQRDEAIKYLDQQYQHEQGLIQLAREQRLLQAKQSYMHEIDYMKERYRLEREEIIKTTRDPVLQNQLLNASFRSEDFEVQGKRRNAWDNFRGLNGELSENNDFLQLDKTKESRSSVVEEATKNNLITEEEGKKKLLDIEERYQRAKLDLQMSYGQQITGSVADMFKTIGGEQSKAYKIMFAAEKAFAIARSIMAIQTGIAEAAANPFPYNLAAMASVAASTASIVSNIQSVASVGFYDGGYTGHGGKYELAGVVHKGEGVLTQDEIRALGGPQGFESLRKSIRGGFATGGQSDFIASQREMNQYNAINSNPSNGSATVLEPIVNVYVMEGQTADVTRNDDGSLDVRIRQIAGEVAEKVFLQGIQNPNSRISKAFKQNYNATPRRQ